MLVPNPSIATSRRVLRSHDVRDPYPTVGVARQLVVHGPGGEHTLACGSRAIRGTESSSPSARKKGKSPTTGEVAARSSRASQWLKKYAISISFGSRVVPKSDSKGASGGTTVQRTLKKNWRKTQRYSQNIHSKKVGF